MGLLVSILGIGVWDAVCHVTVGWRDSVGGTVEGTGFESLCFYMLFNFSFHFPYYAFRVCFELSAFFIFLFTKKNNKKDENGQNENFLLNYSKERKEKTSFLLF